MFIFLKHPLLKIFSTQIKTYCARMKDKTAAEFLKTLHFLQCYANQPSVCRLSRSGTSKGAAPRKVPAGREQGRSPPCTGHPHCHPNNPDTDIIYTRVLLCELAHLLPLFATKHFLSLSPSLYMLRGTHTEIHTSIYMCTHNSTYPSALTLLIC